MLSCRHFFADTSRQQVFELNAYAGPEFCRCFIFFFFFHEDNNCENPLTVFFFLYFGAVWKCLDIRLYWFSQHFIRVTCCVYVWPCNSRLLLRYGSSPFLVLCIIAIVIVSCSNNLQKFVSVSVFETQTS